MIPWLGPAPVFPPVEHALENPNGLLAAGGDLSPRRLIAGYQRGIFPWFSAGDPILWWAPNPRTILFPERMKISRSLGKTLRRGGYTVRLDSDFPAVMAGCAAPRGAEGGTWITPEMAAAYQRLHQLGFAHSVETWIDGELAGGLYGVALGRVFFGESMFSRRTDASKIALAHLCRFLEARAFGVIDCQMNTAHLASLGAEEICREQFVRLLASYTESALHPDYAPGPWPADGAAHFFADGSR